MLTIYGIKNCDTVKKALKWLDAEHIEHTFYDLRANGLVAETAQRWIDVLGWESALNRRSTTWRELPDSDKKMMDATKAAALLVRYPTLAKRPVFEFSDLILNGFSDSVREKLKEVTA